MYNTNKVVDNILGIKPRRDKRSRNKGKDFNLSEELKSDMKTCPECGSLKMKGMMPGVCQYHLDEQFREHDEWKRNR